MARKSTREMIIGVAAGLFGTVGLRKTTMETIAAAAGRGRRTIYMYFSNKAEIYEAVVEDELNGILKPLREIAASEDPFGLVLQNYTAERIRLLKDLGSRNPLLLKDFAMGTGRVERLKERLANEELKVIIPFFNRHLKELNIPAGATVEDCVAIFINILRGTDKFLARENSHKKNRQLSVAGTDLFIKGLVRGSDRK
jgi:AcrR family transcriptional regulator